MRIYLFLLAISLAGCGGNSSSCGSLGAPCCNGSCQGGACVNNVCQQCGAAGQPCCTGRVCPQGFACTGGGDGVCAVCGSAGQACCPAPSCAGGGCCVNGVCAAAGGTCP